MGSIENSYATGVVGAVSEVTAWGTGGLVGLNGGAISNSYSTGQAFGSPHGGFLGVNLATGTLSSDHWDTTTSFLFTGVALDYSGDQAGNVQGMTTTQLQSGLPTGFDPSIWGSSPGINSGLPYLISLSSSY